jgi:hypothetical protein
MHQELEGILALVHGGYGSVNIVPPSFVMKKTKFKCYRYRSKLIKTEYRQPVALYTALLFVCTIKWVCNSGFKHPFHIEEGSELTDKETVLKYLMLYVGTKLGHSIRNKNKIMRITDPNRDKVERNQETT